LEQSVYRICNINEITGQTPAYYICPQEKMMAQSVF